MDFFKHGFLSAFPDTLYQASTFALNNIVLFIVVTVLALEISRRVASHGATFAALIIIGAALYAVGATTYLTW